MNITAKKHPIFPIDKEASLAGVGANAVWAGPMDTTAYPKSPGSSFGKDGIELRFDNPTYKGGSIIKRVKSRV